MYYFANNEAIAKKNSDGTRYYFHNDHLGSTSLLTNSSGGSVELTKYDPWGEVLAGGTKSKFLYTGQEKDSETGLHYYNFRYYNSAIRRFIQPDDIIPNVFNPQSLNRYSYVMNNPLRYTDPTGHTLQNIQTNQNDPLGIYKYTPAPQKYNGGVSIGGFTSVLGSISTSSQPASNNLSAPINNIPGLSNVKGGVSALSGITKTNNSYITSGSSFKSNSINTYINKSEAFTLQESNIKYYLPKTGYVNVGMCAGIGVGGCIGILMNAGEYYYYRSLGGTTPGASPSITYSPSRPQSGNSTSISVSYGLAINANTGFYSKPVNLKQVIDDGSIEAGVSAPGFSVMSTQTMERHNWE